MKSALYPFSILSLACLLFAGCASYQTSVNTQTTKPVKKSASDRLLDPSEAKATESPLVSSPESTKDTGRDGTIEGQTKSARHTTAVPDPYSVHLSEPYYHFIEAQLQRRKGRLDQAIQSLDKSIEMDPGSSYLKRELALLHLQQRNPTKALHVLEKQLELSPEDIELLILYGRIKLGMEQIKDAQSIFEAVIEKDPTKEEVYVLLGRAYMEENDLINASRVFEKMILNFPDSYVGHFYVGKIHAANGDIVAAEEEFQRTIELEPDLEEPRFELLDLYRSQGKDDEIVRLYKEILEKNPDNLVASMELGFIYYQNNAFKEAENIFSSLGKRSLSDPNVLRTVVQHFLETENYDAVIAILEGMTKGAPDSSEIHYIAGIAYNRKENLEMTVKHLEQVKSDSRFYKNAVVNLSLILQEQGKKEEAIRSLNEAIQTLPQDSEFFYYLGRIYEESEEYEKAIDALMQGLEIDPDNVNLRFQLGTIYDQNGLKEASIEEMKTVIRLDPKHAHALNYLGYTYADLGENLDEAERLIKEALKYRPEDGYITDSLGWVYFKKGLLDKAVKILEQAVHLEPNDPIILEHLGDAYLKANDPVKALELYHRSLLKKEGNEADKTELENKIRALTGKEI